MVHAWPVAILSVLTLTCQGSIFTPPAPGKPLPPAVVPLEVPVARLHRLTERQFANSLRELLGDEVPVKHGPDDYPMLVAGKAGGALKGNVHVRGANGTNDSVSKVPFTLLKIMGSRETSFGLNEGRVDSGISELLS